MIIKECYLLQKICPSILSADFAELAKDANRMADAGADMLHVDIMDGQFVPNISLGLPVLECLNKKCDLPMDVHLMIVRPQDYIQRFAKAGADIITFHVESDCNPLECIQQIKACGCKAGISIKPNTPVMEIKPYLALVDMVLVMTVEPGFGGQSFMQDMMGKVYELRSICPDLDIEVDGGINHETAKIVTEAGANVLVAGSYLFGAEDASAAIASLRY
ncbi:ribulose-phosphate 3-epimerase [Clostridium sp. NSJ-27]|uniref:Ribulose-phosphate 3-epimerase n=1 Tax=Clostridium facile TaxID=2763035 RepID=A0ABR7INK2_9CLOT|nr:ribulose-phosphate 3-epimerase [Clostridium facile]